MAQVSTYALTAVLSGLATREQIGLVLTAIQGANSGATAPSNPVEGMVWRDISNVVNPVFRVYRLGAWVAVLSDFGITATPAQINTGLFYTGATAPSSPVEGSRWRDMTIPSAPVDRVYRLGAWVTELADLGITATPAQINSGLVPVGTVAHFADPTPPAGWLVRDGAAYSRTVYAGLFAVIGTRHGAGNGSTTFNAPDDRSNFDRGWDNGRGIDVGRVFGSEQAQSAQDHRHRMPMGFDGGTFYGWQAGTGLPIFGTEVWSGATLTYVSAGTASNTPIRVGYTDVMRDLSGETRPRNRAYLPIIKF